MRVISLGLLAVVYAIGVARLWGTAGRGQGVRSFETVAFACGWLALAVALLPPLDEWSDEWLAAHMIQHELLMVVAAPLLAAAAPGIAMVWALPSPARRRVLEWVRRPPLTTTWTVLTAPLAVFVLHGLALWTWHLPSLYDYALQHESVHVLEHACFFGSAALFWWGIAHGRYGRVGYGVAVLYVFATMVHAGVLGALLTFSPRVWYAPYAAQHSAGLTPLEDQQLAGLLMWIPAGLVTVGGGLILFAAWLRQSDRATRFRSTRTMSGAGPR